MVVLVTGANGQLGNEMRIVSKGSQDRYIFTDIVEVAGLETTILDITNLEAIRKIVKADAIVGRDTYAYVSAPDTTDANAPDLVTTQIENFKKENIAFVPMGNIGNIQGVQPLSMGYDGNDIAYAIGNRLLIEQEGIPRTHSINVNGEMGQLCVPSAVNQMYISTVTV